MKWSRNDFIGPLYWFPVATDRIALLSQKVGRDSSLLVVYAVSILFRTRPKQQFTCIIGMPTHVKEPTAS